MNMLIKTCQLWFIRFVFQDSSLPSAGYLVPLFILGAACSNFGLFACIIHSAQALLRHNVNQNKTQGNKKPDKAGKEYRRYW